MIDYNSKTIYIGQTKNPTETKQIGYYLGQLIDEKLKDISTNIIILLEGQVGSGKTIFAKGIAKQLQVKTNIISPTFCLSKTYQGRNKKIHHWDLYRILSLEKDTIKNNDIISLIEELSEDVSNKDIVLIEVTRKSTVFITNWNFYVHIEMLNYKKRNIIIKQNSIMHNKTKS
ncbi:MAG: tRNA (adenosine(37)-N6)-threonylcarbamoyltransferase complex ATPase subunit type 1 TsaE [Vigna little leaf phytoplasma]|nr:tRNA (adenosine(37)-N6)-threonylcarbamoyltransferase complex ATPase subunit type 1 TsaE [Vigna little leaf phytoplasma]